MGGFGGEVAKNAAAHLRTIGIDKAAKTNYII